MEEYKGIILGTGNYDIKTGNTVSITGDGGNAWEYYGPAYKKLAPRLVTYTPYAAQLLKLEELKKTNYDEYVKFRRLIEDQYIESYYETRLKDLDAYELLKTLKKIFGTNIILLCHEPTDEFCHRRLLADWILLETGIFIPEIFFDEKGKVKQIRHLSYIDRLEKIRKR